MLRKITYLLLLVYFFFAVYTIIGRFFGVAYQPFFTPFLSLLAFTFAVLHAGLVMGWHRALLLLGLTIIVSLLFESIGVATGLIYGPYHYTENLGAKFLNLVPYLIPIVWFMMCYPAFIIAFSLINPGDYVWLWRIGIASTGAVVMTAWDLAMDPLMVAGNHWVWEVEGAYFGIPLQNFWGWWLTIFVILILFAGLCKLNPGDIKLSSSQDRKFLHLAVFSYTITGLSTVISNFQVGLNGPGLVGVFAMGSWIMISWLIDHSK